jgi:hypothetical protein
MSKQAQDIMPMSHEFKVEDLEGRLPAKTSSPKPES